MANIIQLKGNQPKFGKNCFLAENSAVIGDVKMGDNCSIWFGAVLRGDVSSIVLGNIVNIQDGAVLHGTYGKTDVVIGNNVSVGHNAIVHGATVHDNVLIGMGAIVMDYSVIGERSIIAAGSVVLEGTKIEPGSMWAGVPAKFVKKIEPGKSDELIDGISRNYVEYAGWYRKV